ncbi:unnamed protein product [Cylicocyclus nassatus]|uniref:Uncharacterized protein n=1 Tax=Cylicocyclus nassatus TaxID=53992 RepID=A0AA36GXX0_CYLNA|nr:unnamed protein product [Cylicocyclus nassatus]
MLYVSECGQISRYVMQVYTLTFLISTILTMASSTTDAQALVVYDDNQAPLKRFAEKEKVVKIGSHIIRLQQNWNENGVAGVLWDSATVLSEYLLRNDIVRDRRVLELGAGLGLPSIVAAKLFAFHVTATDQPSALSLLHQNLEANLDQKQMSTVAVAPLDWTNPPKDKLPCDVVLGADLVYDKSVFGALKNVITWLVEGNTIMLMATKIRYPKDREFYETLKDEFSVEQVHYDEATDVILYSIKRKREEL